MKRILFHSAFWLVYLFQDVLLVFLLNTTRTQQSTSINLFLSFTNCLVLLLPKMFFTYFMLYVTLDKLVDKEFQTKGILYTILALIIAILCYRGLVSYVVNPIVYGLVSPTSAFFYPLAFPVALMDIGFVSGAAIALKQIRQQLKRAQIEQQLIREKLEVELKYLRNQTNPHFLFNTLNNIYALARKKSDDTADAVMKLSKILRFMLFETAKPLITIGDEIQMLEDYIDLEKIRYDGRLTIRFSKDLRGGPSSISPLLLLPFIENAFKHGASESQFASFIHVDIKLQEDILTFSVSNSKEDKCREGANIGLRNVERQLELLYTEYDMRVVNEPSVYSVLLTINLKSYAKNSLSHH
ncbi:sensor histidine kinase [Spirosoma radiotolerans]|uniref:sensor histidine kinase n=1 Tax=Spirosoma radiotolerans TaxID=1379870 RepID=UPI000AE1B5D1|nr:histidine kinase [Spirosoma radiotolerans]